MSADPPTRASGDCYCPVAGDQVRTTASAPLLSLLLAEIPGAPEEMLHELAALLRPYLAEDPKRLLDTREKARQLDLHPDVLTRMVRDRRIPWAVKVGREWRFPAKPVEILPPPGRPTLPLPPNPPRRQPASARASLAAIRGNR
jgi:hypothetical protein